MTRKDWEPYHKRCRCLLQIVRFRADKGCYHRRLKQVRVRKVALAIARAAKAPATQGWRGERVSH